MSFLKENRLWDNEKSKSSQFKKGVSVSTQTQFQKGKEPWNKGKKGYYRHTEEWKKQRSEEMSGEKHPLWLKDRSLLKTDRLKAFDCAYKEWSSNVKNRDNWKCRISNQDCKGRLEAHHILNWIDFPELRYQPNNGITLCQAHHPRKRAEEKRLIPEFQILVSVSSILN